MSANKVFGIDLGTTYSCISQVDRYGRPEVISNMDGDATTPSVVQFQGDDVIVGKLAKRSSRLDPDNVAQLVKRHIGEADWRFHAGGREWSAAGVSSLILGALAKDAERATGERVDDVVITVPAYFGNEERKQTRLAGELAGLNVLDLINEPTAAAYAYGFAQEGAANESILVYDLGGGTFDITIIALEGDGIRVVATDGDHELGGANWDTELASLLGERFMEQRPDATDPFDDVYAEADLLTQAEEVKQSLSQRERADVLVTSGADRASVSVTREDLEDATNTLLERTIELTRRALMAAASKGVTRDRPLPARRRLLEDARGRAAAARGVRLRRAARRPGPRRGQGRGALRPEEAARAHRPGSHRSRRGPHQGRRRRRRPARHDLRRGQVGRREAGHQRRLARLRDHRAARRDRHRDLPRAPQRRGAGERRGALLHRRRRPGHDPRAGLRAGRRGGVAAARGQHRARRGRDHRRCRRATRAGPRSRCGCRWAATAS